MDETGRLDAPATDVDGAGRDASDVTFVSVTGTMLRDLVLCERRLHHDLHAAAGGRDPVSDFVQMLWSGGSAHEARTIASLAGGIVDLRNVARHDVELATMTALDGDAEWVVGARIAHGDLLGMPDLLRRVGGEWFAGDVKSGSPFADDGVRPRTEYAVQVGLYAAIMGAGGYGRSDRAFVIGADGTLVWYDLHAPSGRDGVTVAGRVDALVAHARRIRDGAVETLGALSAACGLCHWRTLCTGELERADDLTLVAGLGRSLRDAIAPVAGTVATLAALELKPLALPGGRTSIRGVGRDRLARFRDRARLLATPGAGPYARRPLGLGRSARELHFDIESDPLNGGLVYLHGILELTAGPAERFHGFFADGPDGEREAFAAAFAFLTADPSSTIFFYSKFERTSYRVLQARYPDVCGAGDIEALFSSPRTIDLLGDVVMPHTEWPTRSVGIKTLAKHLGFRWRDADASGAASIAWFHEWTRTRDPEVRRRILEYNEDDCRATAVLLDGLIALPVRDGPPWPPGVDADPFRPRSST